MNRFPMTAIVAALSICAVADAAIDSPIHRTFNAGSGGTLTLETDVGDVRVNSGGSNVTVDVRRRARDEEIMRNFNVTFDQSGNDVTIRAKYDHASRWFSWGNELSAQFIITVPTNFNVHASTSGGNVQIADLNGDVRARTSGGDLEIGNITGPVEARTSGGDARLAGAGGSVDLRTSGGSLHIGDVKGGLQARTSGGSIEVRRVGGDLYAHTSGGSIVIEEANGTVDAETSGGSIRARLAQQPRADSRLSTSGGSITLSVAGNVAVDLDAHTSGGDVETDIPITILGKQSDSTLEGKINGGGPRLVLRSSGGGIHVKRL